MLVTSAKQSFIVGADINGFAQLFSLPNEELIATNMRSNRVFQDLESLPYPW